MLAILGAIKQEIGSIRGRMSVSECWAHKDWRAYRGRYATREILLAETGTGKAKAIDATRAILDRYPVTAVASVGFAGALDEGLEVGDIVIYGKAYCKVGDSPAVGEACSCDTGLLLRASAVGKGYRFRMLEGNGISVLKPVIYAEDKKDLGKKSSASAVDMESYWIGKTAEEKGIPFVAIRAISDAVEKPVLPFERLVDEDGFKRRKAIVYFLEHPWQVPNLILAGRNASVARKNLTLFMDYFIAREPVVGVQR